MTGLLDVLYLVSLSLWVGGLVFYAFIAAPGLGKSLDEPAAARARAGLAPQLRLLGYACGGVGFVSLAFIAQVDETGSAVHWLRMLAGMLLLQAFDERWLEPRIEELRSVLKATPSPILSERLERLSRASAWAGRALLVLGLLLLAFTSQRLAYY